MKPLCILIACLALVGCDYTVPITDTPTLDIDNDLVGLWQEAKDGGGGNALLVLPFSQREYMVAFPNGSKDGLFAKAFACSCAGKTLIQLQWMGTAKGAVPEEANMYQYAACELEGAELRILLMNPAVVSKDIDSSSALIKAIEQAKDNPALFRPPMVFRRQPIAANSN